MRIFLLVLDSVGIGAAPDADAYGDTGANTLAHTAAAVGGLHLPTLQQMGLGNIPALLPKGLSIEGVPPNGTPTARYGALKECSRGKDTTTGHWEMAGLLLETGFSVFPPDVPSFPAALTQAFEEKTGRGILGNCAASGTAIIEALGEEQKASGKWIVYTSADSVLQIAAHEDVIPLDELYKACRIARDLCDPYTVGRVIARPYVGEPGRFSRTQNRRDFSYPMPEPCLLDHLGNAGIKTVTVGKLDDIFVGAHICQSCHVENTPDAQECMMQFVETLEDQSFVFANYIDFDMLYGHRRDPEGYARALEQTDEHIGAFVAAMKEDDVLLISADHGNDPTFAGSDHTREYVPLLAHGDRLSAGSIGVRNGFFDVAQSIASTFGLPPMPRGIPFLP